VRICPNCGRDRYYAIGERIALLAAGFVLLFSLALILVASISR
jgi:hypothetical protein